MSVIEDKPTTRRELKRLETRRRLFEAALAEFQRVGFADAQIDRIVEAAGVARGTFYFHFPSKEHVLMQLQRQYEEQIVENVHHAMRARPPTGVRAFLKLLLDAMLEASDATADPRIAREMVGMYARAPRYVTPADLPIMLEIADFFSDAAERGEIRADLAPEDATRTFLTLLWGFVVGAEQPLANREEFEGMLDIFVRGIQP